MSRELRLPSLNKVIITGNCTHDPEVRYTQSGAAMCSFGIASNRAYRDKNNPNEWKEETTFVRVVTWRQLAERLGDQLSKGSAVLVEGRLDSRSWEAEDGSKRTTIEISADRVQALDRRGSGSSPAYAGGGGGQAADSGGGGGGSMPSDDLPF